MLLVGLAIGAAFALYEWKLATIPIMPCECLHTESAAKTFTSDFEISETFQIPEVHLPILPIFLLWHRLLRQLLLRANILSERAALQPAGTWSAYSSTYYIHLHRFDPGWSVHVQSRPLPAADSFRLRPLDNRSRYPVSFESGQPAVGHYSGSYRRRSRNRIHLTACSYWVIGQLKERR